MGNQKTKGGDPIWRLWCANLTHPHREPALVSQTRNADKRLGVKDQSVSGRTNAILPHPPKCLHDEHFGRRPGGFVFLC